VEEGAGRREKEIFAKRKHAARWGAGGKKRVWEPKMLDVEGWTYLGRRFFHVSGKDFTFKKGEVTLAGLDWGRMAGGIVRKRGKRAALEGKRGQNRKKR